MYNWEMMNGTYDHDRGIQRKVLGCFYIMRDGCPESRASVTLRSKKVRGFAGVGLGGCRVGGSVAV